MVSTSVTNLIGRSNIAPEILDRLKPEELAFLAEANYSLRHYGFGPYNAAFVDASGIEIPFNYSGHSERRVQGAAHIVQRAVGIIQRMTPSPKPYGFEAALAVKSDAGDALRHTMNGLRNYQIDAALLGRSWTSELDQFLVLDLKTTKIVIRNKRGQIIYQSTR